MFYEIAQEGEPSEYELKRLRTFEEVGRRNNLLLEFFDLGTDLAFMLVLFDQAGAITLPEAWALYSATTGSKCPGAPAFTNQETVLNLAIASAVILGVNFGYRLLRACMQVHKGRREIKDPASYVHVAAGMLISIIDPWNGSLMINEVMESDSSRLERNDYNLALKEFVSDLTLVMLEDVPQLIVQIIYGSVTGQTEHVTVAWFVAIFSTVLHLASQTHELIFIGMQLPKLKKLQEEQDAASRGG